MAGDQIKIAGQEQFEQLFDRGIHHIGLIQKAELDFALGEADSRFINVGLRRAAVSQQALGFFDTKFREGAI